jgi:phosphoribosylglycinamide formyltransferase-1
MATLDLGVLVSGSGTNLQSILDAIGDGRLDARVRLVISNKPGARALERASDAGVPTLVIRHKQFASREAFDQALVDALVDAGVSWVVLAGFMRLLTPVFLDAFKMRVINIHPALLPSFPGVDAQQQALSYGVRVTGCTVHFVDAGTDTGPIIGQAVVPVHHDDTRDTLAHRVLAREHELFVTALQWIAQGRVRVVPPQCEGARPSVRVDGVDACLGLAEAP